MHRYVLDHRISHADVDLLGEMKVTSLLGLLEQAAVEASWDCGFDPAWYSAERRVWIIRRTRAERMLPVGGGDVVRVATHVLDWRRARSLRRYEVRLGSRLPAPARGEPDEGSVDAGEGAAGGEGPLVARATTDWVYCDMASVRPASVPEEMRRAFSGDAHLVTLPRARPLPEVAAGSPTLMPLTVRASHLDHVTHVNNAAYAGFLEDGAFELFAAHGLSLERMLVLGGALRVRRIDLEYLDDAVAGDRLEVRSWLLSGPTEVTEFDAGPGALDTASGPPSRAHLLQTIRRADGSRLLRAESEWVWRKRPTILGGVPRT